MNKRIRFLSGILLLLINCVGIIGAFLQILEIPWAGGAAESFSEEGAAVCAPDPVIFWGGLFLLCVAAVLLSEGMRGKKAVKRMFVCVIAYITAVVAFGSRVGEEVLPLLRNFVDSINERYLFHIVWSEGTGLLRETGEAAAGEAGIVAVCLLFVLFPLVLLLGVSLSRGRSIGPIAGNVLWLTAACTRDLFPDFFFLTFCVLGMTAVLVWRNFREEPEEGLWAVAWSLLGAGLCIGAVCRFLLPAFDAGYERMEAGREELYGLVNDEWIPALQRALPGSGFGFGSGPNVSGSFNRENIFAYTGADVYRVTVDDIPPGALYLKGFVGSTYGDTEWEPEPDREMERYYEEKGFTLPRDYGELSAISYEALRALHPESAAAHIRIEEAGGRADCSLYPYGALLTEDFRVHGDGSVERKGNEYGYRYYYPEGFGRAGLLPEELRNLERQYRQYVSDTFRDYPEEKLPGLTEHLKQELFATGDKYLCILQIMEYLDRQADYDLDAGRNPEGTDFTEYFLYESHEGYCVHFATAAVLILRYCGIPARYVTGYVVTPADFTESGSGAYTAVLTGRQAHAWAEIYIDGIGWLPVEMTPGAVAFAEDYRIEQAGRVEALAGRDSRLPELGDRQEAEQTPEPEESPVPESSAVPEQTPEDADGESEERAPENVRESEPPGLSEESGDGLPAVSGNGLEIGNDTDGGKGGLLRRRVLGGVLAAAVVPVLWVAMVRMLRKRRIRRFHGALREAGSRERIFLLYANLRKALRSAGCPGRLSVDGEAFWHKLLGILPDIGEDEYRDFCVVLRKNSFGNTEPSGEELLIVLKFHDRLISAAREQAPFYKKSGFMTAGDG